MQTMAIFGGLATAMAIGLGSAPALAQTATPWVEGYNSKTRMMAGTVAKAGAQHRLVAGVEVQMPDGWKTYWRSPGDAGGVPPHFDWAGSENLGTAKVLYPAPERLKDASGDSVGYKKSVVFPIEITPKDATKPVTLNLALEFGVCREICVPAEAKLGLVLPVGVAAVAPNVVGALDLVPRKAIERRAGDPELKAGRALLNGEMPKLQFDVAFPDGIQGADLFVEAPDGIFLALPKMSGSSGAVQTFEIVLDSGIEPGNLKGKTLTLTMVAKTGQSEAAWKVN